ncbi:N-acetylneuraminate synthase family protein [Kiloniella sp.]|uniref:N-acetylneuraminate synthase family protein n=1 Tax=Kiloniella sp. TaxID=1938587 RepID=UPI003B018E46
MQKKNVMINDTVVGDNAAPYVIAEAGSNFNQDLNTARSMIDVAADAGANAVKFQLFRANFLYPDGGELHDIFKSIELNPEWVPLLAEHAKKRGIHFMASAFDTTSLDVLESVDVPTHKIASSETTNLQFLHYAALTGKPIIISTGMCDMVDIEEAVNVCRATGNNNIILMQCGAMYPLPSELANLRVITTLENRFGCPTGFSDHTLGQTASIAAVGLGANIFEKHFTLDRNSEGPDHFYALEPAELKAYVDGIHEAYQSLGCAEKEMLPKEREIGRREGLYLIRDMAEGDVITASDLDVKRPALGLRERYAPSVVGARLTVALKAGVPLTWKHLSFKE